MKRLIFSALAALLVPPMTLADTQWLLRPDVQRYIDEQVTEGALTRAELETVFANAEPKPSIIGIMDRPSTSRPWYQFRPNFFNEKLLANGVAFWKDNAATLNRAEAQYGVAPEMIVTILGIETQYGRTTGSFRAVDALATLAFDYPRRADFFRAELTELLRLAREENRNALALKGSYAGAMGYPQFMPSSFRKWAVSTRKLFETSARII